MDFESICAKEVEDTEFNPPHIQAVYLSSSYKFNSLQEGIEIFNDTKEGNVYSRYGHPNHISIARKLSLLEAAGSKDKYYALVTNSGMSAINTVLTGLCKAGDSILYADDLYGGTTDLILNNLNKTGIQSKSISFHDLKIVEAAIKENNADVLFFESPSNPLLHCYDIQRISAIAKNYQCRIVVDNTFNTSMIQQPLKLGADVVVYSTTKYLNGHGNALGGAIISDDRELIERHLLSIMRLNGSTISPFDAWLLSQGLKTLPLRLNKQQENAKRIAELLSERDDIQRVYFPGLKNHSSHEVALKQMNGFGAMISFELKGDPYEFMKGLELITLAPTLGDLHTLVLHPASMSHRNMPEETKSRLGISNKLIRLSVGIESINDLEHDIIHALEGI